MQALFACLSGGAAALLQNSFARSISYGESPMRLQGIIDGELDRPVHTLVLSFIACAILLNVVNRLYPRLSGDKTSERKLYTDVPLEDFDIAASDDRKEKEPFVRNGLSLRKQLGLVATGIACLTLRLEFYQRILNTQQCASRSYSVFLPLLLGLYDLRQQNTAQLEIEDSPDSSVYDGLRANIKVWLIRPKWRYIPSSLVLAGGCYAVSGLWTAQTSTYICPIASGHAASIPRLQQYSLLLDFVLAVITNELSKHGEHSRLSMITSYSTILLGSASCWIGYAVLLFIARPEHGHWLFLLDSPSLANMMSSIIWQIILFCILVITTVYNVSQKPRGIDSFNQVQITTNGVFHVSLLLTAVLTLIPGLQFVWTTRHPFPPTSSGASFWAFLAIYLGLWSYWRVRQVLEPTPSSRSSAWQLLPLLLLFVALFPGIVKNNSVHFHPIKLLIYDARGQHDRYLRYAGYSTALETAVAVYQGRYESEPPPGFDIWWEFAQNRSVTVIDDFDQIFVDLLPFRMTLPSVLRRQTWELVSNPYNEISGISIRGGKAEVQANVLPTHRWMLEGVATFIDSFAEHLPDMDLAFNLNDESRVAVPYDDIDRLKSVATSKQLRGIEPTWSDDRAEGWLPTAEEDYTESLFENWSFQNTFAKFGAIGCAPGTKARTTRSTVPQPYLCTECVAPHSFAQFVSDWPLAADPCHQPDLTNLHGFYNSPAAFKTSHDLLPVFSQSKAHGYNDILYPSAWNYMDKVRYAPTNPSGVSGTDEYNPGFPDLPFAEKLNTLYWRGATSEGVSPGNRVWRGMTRQRLVHMANNLTTSHHDHVTVLLPDSDSADKYTYHSLSAQSFLNLGLQTDIKLVDHIARCGGVDCTDQEHEFALVGPVDFQAHWKYRYLFDMDGAGFSGRFLPFLQSHSLPFKTALFREWYDSRLTAWRHFVPQDLRLHGVWSTLAYFAGIDGISPKDGKPLHWPGNPEDAEFIAEEGRNWAGRVLRKEDMEVYFFRLLLEWARLTDDRRDELGFVLKKEDV